MPMSRRLKVGFKFKKKDPLVFIFQLQVKHNKLFGISDKGKSIKEIDYELNSIIESTQSFNIERVIYQFSMKMILVQTEK
jgi:hypothetical protein